MTSLTSRLERGLAAQVRLLSQVDELARAGNAYLAADNFDKLVECQGEVTDTLVEVLRLEKANRELAGQLIDTQTQPSARILRLDELVGKLSFAAMERTRAIQDAIKIQAAQIAGRLKHIEAGKNALAGYRTQEAAGDDDPVRLRRTG
ncbi:hypothetical protein K8I61_15525 [bacterium]|nr:hypothetical protein [bacterium]